MDRDALREGLYGDGIIGLAGAFEPSWADRLGEELDVLLRVPGPGAAFQLRPRPALVDELEPISQAHTIGGLTMGRGV